MRRLSIQGYVFSFLLPASPHPPPPLVLLIPSSLSPAPHIACMLVCLGGSQKDVTRNYQAKKHHGLYGCVQKIHEMNVNVSVEL